MSSTPFEIASTAASQRSTPAPRKSRIAGLDGIRGIAATSVVFCHTVAGSTQIGGYAVNIFFVLSGYLILDILYRSRRAIEAREDHFGTALADFWRRRIARICPVYYFVAIIALVVYSGPVRSGRPRRSHS